MNTYRPRILAIDDNPQNIVMLATALETVFDFQLASSGPEGLALAAICPPDLILLDVMMPEVDGFETCRRFKADRALSAIPIIFLSALSDLETELSGLALGAVDYLFKPVNVILVRQRISNLLQLTRLTQELKSSEERLRLVMEATGEGIWDWALQSDLVVHNASWCKILGLDDSFLKHSLTIFKERIHPDDLPQLRSDLDACLAGGNDFQAEYRLRHTDGHYVWVQDRGKVVQRSSDGAALRMVGSIQNIEERKQYEARIQRLAFFDTLTGLPNRRLLMDRLAQAMAKSRRSGKRGALLFIDLDRFKQINDTHGHDMGDTLLVQVATRLHDLMRGHDVVARLGGDEFVVMIEELPAAHEAARSDALVVARKIITKLNEPYQLGKIQHSSTPSIGLTLFAGKADSVDHVLKRADLAMYRAKAAGRNGIRMSDDDNVPLNAKEITR